MFTNRRSTVRNSNEAVDPHWTGVVSSLHFNGSNGSTVFTDVKGKTWTRNGTTTEISTAQSRFGSSALSISPTNNVAGGISTPASADWDFGVQDFTIEMWAYNTSWTNGAGNQQFLLSRYNGNGGPYLMQVLSNGQFQCLASNTNASWIVAVSGGTFPLNQWNHLAFCRRGPNFMAYLNGERVGLTTNNISLFVDAEAIWLGSTRLNNVLQWGGYIDDFRVTKGRCRYPENFNPPLRQNPDFGFTPNNDFVSYVTSTSPQGHSALGAHDGSNYFYNDVTTTYSSNFQRKTVNADSDALTNAGGGTSGGPIPGRGSFIAMTNYPAITNDGSSHPIHVAGIGASPPEGMSFAIAVRPTVNASSQICSMNVYFASSFAAFPIALWYFNRQTVSLQLSIGNDYSSDVIITAPDGTVPLNKWSYIVVRYDTVSGGNGPVSLYVNNVKYTGTRTAAFAAYSGGFAIGSPWQHYQGGKSPTPIYFYGEMAEFTYWTTTPTSVTDGVVDNLYTRFRRAAGPAQVTYSDPYLSNVVSLLHFDSPDGSGPPTDETEISWTSGDGFYAGSIYVDTGLSRFGAASLHGVQARLKTPNSSNWDFGSGSWTIEFWLNTPYLTSPAAQSQVLVSKARDIDYSPFYIALNTNGSIGLYVSTSGSAWATSITSAASSIAINTWYHVAAVRDGNTLRLFINGVQVGAGSAFSGALMTNTRDVTLFGPEPFTYGASTFVYRGYMDEFRVTKGVARYTADFAPQQQAFISPGLRGVPYAAYTTSLLHFEGTDGSTAITDVKGITWDAINGATISTARSKFGSSSLALTTTAGSRIAVNPATMPALGGGDYTVEFFVWLNTNGSYRALFDTRDFGVANSATRITVYWASDTSTMRFYQGGADRITGGNLTTGAWHHVCVERYNGIVRMFLNGTQVGGTYADTATINNTGAMLGVVSDAPTAWDGFNGNFDEFRILVGVARYKGASFVPPTAPHPDA